MKEVPVLTGEDGIIEKKRSRVGNNNNIWSTLRPLMLPSPAPAQSKLILYMYSVSVLNKPLTEQYLVSLPPVVG